MATADVVVRRPHAALRRYVGRYVGYRLSGYPPGIHRGLPSRLLTFIVRLDEPRAFVAGLRTRPALIPHEGEHFGIAIELTARGSRALLATPPGALVGQTAELTDVAGPRQARLAERIAEAPSWDARFALLDEAFLRSLDPRREPPGEVVHAWRVLTRSSERVNVEALAREVGWSRRHLSEVFAREIGLPPRQLVRVVRFERSCALVRAGQRPTMTEIALQAGYFDHAHMLHEWHRLAGCRPDEWLAEELLSVQAEAGRQDLGWDSDSSGTESRP